MTEKNNQDPFYLQNGQVLNNLEDLKAELEKNCKSINLDNFYSHVTEEKNDYANWIKHVFKDEELAKKIERHKEPKKVLDTIKKHKKTTKKKKTKSKTEKFIEDINECEKLAKQEKVSEAKKKYNELRANFLKTKFSKEENEEIHTKIKDLYYTILNS